MKKASRENETQSVGERRGCLGKLGAVSVPVENGKCRHDQGCNPQRRPQFERDHNTKNHRRRGDADLDAGKRNSADAKQPSERHHERKSYGENPNGWALQLSAPDSDGDHRENMVESR